jgi:tetratricopeptide (TPR) repeat protein
MRYAEVVMAALLGEAFSVSGRLEDAVGLLERAWQFAEPRALHAYGQPVLSSLGDVYGRVGRIQEAVVTGQRALELARKCGQRGYEARTLYVLGNIHGYGGTPNLNQSRLHYQQALVLAQELGMRPLEVQCRFALGELAGTAGERQTARELLAAAASGFHEMGMQTWPERAESALKRIDAR